MQTDLKEGMKKILKNKIVLGGLGAVAALLAIVIIVRMQPDQFNLEEYVRISCSGYDGYAKAYAVLDENALYESICEAKGLGLDIGDYESFEQIGSAVKDAYALAACVDSIELNVSPNANISNGDELVVEIRYNNELAKAQKIKFKGESVKETIEGLEPIVEIDPFEDLEVTFSGTAPNGSVEFACSDNNRYLSSYAFKAQPSYGLKNGDIVTISLNQSDEETISNGFIATQKEQKYEVSGLDEFVDTYADLTEELLEKMKSEAEDVIYSYTGERYDNDTSMSGLSYAGYIMNIETTNGGCVDNELYLIFKGTVTNTQEGLEAVDVYYPVAFLQIMIKDGMLDYYSTEAIAGYSYFEDSWMGTEGYLNPVTCHMEIAKSNNENYSSECGGGFEVYASYEMVTGLVDISQEYKAVLYAEAKALVDHYIENEYYDDFKAQELEGAGECLLVAKEADAQNLQKSKYIIVYSAIISHDKSWFEPTRVYFPVEYDGILKLGNGEYIVFESPDIIGRSTFPGSYSTTRGFVDGKQMLDKVVNAERVNYMYELSEELKEFEK